jgi:hypothetical protein
VGTRRSLPRGHKELVLRRATWGIHVKIEDVRAHHVRIPYDAGVATFKQGASSIAAVDIVLLELTTDTGLTGW